MNRIFCEVCNSNDLIKQDGVFVCQSCGTKYSLEEIKKQLVEIAGPVQVVGVDNADTLYNRALDWLNLQNNAKAIEVLKDMTEKYPGDIRGWSKLARLKPEMYSIDNAVRLGDVTLRADLAVMEAEKTRRAEAAAQAACDAIRNGQGTSLPYMYKNYPCVQQLLKEGEENADFYKRLCSTIKVPFFYKSGFAYTSLKRNSQNYGSSYTNALRYILTGDPIVFEVGKMGPVSITMGPVTTIIGNLFCYEYYESHGGSDDWTQNHKACFPANKVITRPMMQQAFQDVEKFRVAKVCPYCGNKRSAFSADVSSDGYGRKCRRCNKYSP